MTETELRALVVETAQSWLGLREGDGSHCLIVDTYNAHRPLPRGYRLSGRDAWCAATVSALAIVTDLTDIIPVECSCGYMIDRLRGLGAWVEADGFVPRPGDIIFYDWQDGGSGDDRGAADHVGVVETASDGRLSVIEGNKGGAVARRTMQVNGRYIRGYGRPDYAAEAAARSLWELARLKVLNSPAYWRGVLVRGEVRWLDRLLCNGAAVITAPGQRTDTPQAGLEALVRAGVVSTPDYWEQAMAEHPSVGRLLQALGGAVQV